MTPRFGCGTLQLKIDLHVHSHYSIDSLITVKDLEHYAKKQGLDGVAVTDHDRLDSALKIAKGTDFLIIPGIEITSLNGHIVGLNVQEPIQKGLTAKETLDRIHKAGGVAVACHPTAFFKGSVGKHTNSSFDAVEVVNASAVPFKHSVEKSRQIAYRLGLPQVGGSDAHYGPEIGLAHTIIDAEPTGEDIVNAVKKGMCEPFGEAIPFLLRAKREFLVLGKRLMH